jgi:hypothetical protein
MEYSRVPLFLSKIHPIPCQAQKFVVLLLSQSLGRPTCYTNYPHIKKNTLKVFHKIGDQRFVLRISSNIRTYKEAKQNT